MSICDSGEQSSSKGQFWVNRGVDRSDQIRNAGVPGKRGPMGPVGPPGLQGPKVQKVIQALQKAFKLFNKEY